MEISIKHRRGDVRADGMVFVGYGYGYIDGERWATPEGLNALRDARKKYAQDYRKTQKSVEYRRAYLRIPEVAERYLKAKRRGGKPGQPKIRDAEYFRTYNREWKKRRKASHPEYKLSHIIRGRINSCLKYKKSKGLSTASILGCSMVELKLHLEKQFLPGMTWDNHGQIGWHVDHIIPLSTATTEADVIRLNHYSNLQPLWYYDNVRKNPKRVKQFFCHSAYLGIAAFEVENKKVINGKVY